MMELQCHLNLMIPVERTSSPIWDFTPKLKPPSSSPTPSAFLLCTNFKSSLIFKRGSFKCSCSKIENTQQVSSPPQHWEQIVHGTMQLHGALWLYTSSVCTFLLVLEALSLLGAQFVELIAAMLLLQITAKPHYKFANSFKADKLSNQRNWLLASAVGFGSLFVLVFLTSFLADIFIGPKDINNPVLKEILVRSNISKAACVFVYCVTTPLLEETVYRGFLLGSISSTMKWQSAVFISSIIFSAAHFSGENFLQLFIVGCVLGSSYCWTGNLRSSILIHSLYNAMTLMITFLS
ncbi:uncharacterized protein LOC126798697 isoform X2 [Argentina anserina]|uniref:uncharacterized protein LOC126798697 isoform X2 n=1 Tax=Argentina anserina TaxID=57926 RepID=UPI0021768C9B|nr:uncharacterized protein LOC126798697 isoform X2 [Potentilla anserina]